MTLRLALAATGAGVVCGLASALPLPQAPGCPVFPRDNVWNQRVDRLPVARDSAALVRSIGADTGGARRLRLGDAGTARRSGSRSPSSAPGSRKVRVAFEYADETDKGPYPIPANVRDRGRRRPARA